MPNVLVFPAGSEIGLEIERSLRHVRHFKVFGCSSVADHAPYAYEFMTNPLPYFSDPNFTQKLSEVINHYKIDFIFPAHDDLVELLPQLKQSGQLPEHVKIVGSPLNTSTLARSKRATYEHLKNFITTPNQISKESITQDLLPLFAKPDRGQGSKGANKISNIQELATLPLDSVITEFLPGDEYTIDCFTDRNGVLRFSGGRTRARVSNGISVSSIEYFDDEFQRLAEQINSALSFRGMWFFQLKRRKDHTLVLLEIAPRVSGGMGFFRAKGINLPLLALYDLMNLEIDIFANHFNLTRDCALYPSYSLDLEFSDVYIDLDDTLIFDHITNSDLMGLIYKWKNQSKNIHLITRHRAVHGIDPLETLHQHKIIASLFSSVIEVSKGQLKSTFIDISSAIFIDDSASERLDVHNVCSIPTFTCQQATELFARSKGNF